ncbi:MAG: DUF1343 domain-containing protein [Sphingobacteriia bacterium]|nr:MAG: DUF1343 domain-containing protein [Sphingobacteriia bacterium]TAG30085.1 MAG: DUF1343 domain-containing protein [Sphingobacteriia bacterium]
MSTLLFGVDKLLGMQPHWKHLRIGMVTNEAATTNGLVPSRLALQKAGYNIVLLFSPEHGLNAKGADGAVMLNGIDELTDLPIVSLYGHKLAPDETDLAAIDLLLFDIPDIGVRFYTYLWTLTHVLEAAAKHQKPLVVLDRPNPLSGDISAVEGPLLEASTASFIGRWPIPLRHSCTMGELAHYFNSTQKIGATLEVIACEGWNRNEYQLDWQIGFVPTSPAIQNFNSILLYPGLCLLEATNISEGRSTPLSFQVAGAPWINHGAVCSSLNAIMDGELEAIPIEFLPRENKYAGEICKGIQLSVTDPISFRSVFFGLILLKVLKGMHPSEFKFTAYKTHVNPSGINHLDKLLGIPNSEALFELPFVEFLRRITVLTAAPNWKATIAGYLMY